MAYLKWIDDSVLVEVVGRLLSAAAAAKKSSETNFNKNVIDPFSAVFEIAGFGIDHRTWQVSEKTRQAQKTLQNSIGNFHQAILGNVKGWDNLNIGNVVDLVSTEQRILAEVKNKHNTVKGNNLGDLYKALEGLVNPKSSRYKDFKAYYVTIIPKRPQRFDKPFTPSDARTGIKYPTNENIRIIDGASFYSLVTNEKEALSQLFKVLPSIISSCSNVQFNGGDLEEISTYFSKAYGDS